MAAGCHGWSHCGAGGEEAEQVSPHFLLLTQSETLAHRREMPVVRADPLTSINLA